MTYEYRYVSLYLNRSADPLTHTHRKLRPVPQAEPLQPPLRLVKSWLPADLVRQVDATVLASGGAYVDRSEFIAEAIRDRLAEEEVERAQEQTAPALPASKTGSEDALFGDWLGRDLPTLRPAEGPATNYGLHNRDYPTLWALDWLARLVAEAKRPVGWDEYLARLLPLAWTSGRALAATDGRRTDGYKAATGFPTNMKRKESAQARFATHAVGSVGARGNDGPLFVFRLVGLQRANDNAPTAAPTQAAVALMRALRDAGIGDGPPFSEQAWRAFSAFLDEWAPAELEAWRYVLTAIGEEEPDRATLVERCDRWQGSTAETNVMSYVARGREWGLVEPALVDGHYRLTDFGREQMLGSAAPRKVMQR